MSKNKVVSNVKDQELIKKRRDQMIKGAISLFKEKGFHRTTTREIAKASG
ncbi:TetR/AcrR family transcriptional regulator, partial [Oceanobacillus caeni]